MERKEQIETILNKGVENVLPSYDFLRSKLEKGINPRDIKMRLAYEVTKSVTDDKKAKEAEDAFVLTFQKKETNNLIKEIKQNQDSFEEVFINEKIVKSKSELRRLIEAKAVSRIEDKKI